MVSVKGKSSAELQSLDNFSDGLAKAKLKVPGDKYGAEWIFINKEGEIVLNVTKLFKLM